MNRIGVLVSVLGILGGVQAALGQRIVVVNIGEVSDRYDRREELEAVFDLKQRELQADRAARLERIERGIKSLEEDFKPGSEEYLRRRKELALSEAELQYDIEIRRKEIEKGMAATMRSIFDDIQETVAELAKEKGYDVVLAVEALPDQAPDTPSLARQQIVFQKALYWNPALDVSAEVIQRLNARHRERKAAAPPTGSGGGKEPEGASASFHHAPE